MSRRRNKKNKTNDQQKKPPVTIYHSADRRCIVGQPVPKKTNYRPTAR